MAAPEDLELRCTGGLGPQQERTNNMSCLSRRKPLLQQVAALILLLVVMFLTRIAWDCFLLKPDFRILKGVQLKQLSE